MERESTPNELTVLWEQRIKQLGADFVFFVDITALPREATDDYTCAVLFGKALSKEYIRAVRDDLTPATKEIFNTERKMDALAEKIAALLQDEGYNSTGRLKTGKLPHKTVALRAGLGFIGKNNLLVTEEYGCAVMLGKVLTAAPFTAVCTEPKKPECAGCTICTDCCRTGALKGTTWSVTTTREQILTRKLCNLCHKCMVLCPYTEKYANS